MANPPNRLLPLPLLFLLLLLFPLATSVATPTPTPWPLQFHSVLYVNYTGALSVIDLWYDWPNGRNFNIIQKQLGELLYDLEWTNGTSFFYTLDQPRKCSTYHLDVGILRPDWLDGATYVGPKQVDGFLCNAWRKADFITYYEDVETKRPVGWVFYTGRTIHVMTFEVGAVLEDAKWQAPVYCFEKDDDDESKKDIIDVAQHNLFQKKVLAGPTISNI